MNRGSARGVNYAFAVAAKLLIVNWLAIVWWAKMEAAEKVPLYMLISCNYILIVAGYFVSLSY